MSEALTFAAGQIAYREALHPGERITLKKITEIRKDANGVYRAVGFLAAAASDLRMEADATSDIPEGSALRVVFGRILASEAPRP